MQLPAPRAEALLQALLHAGGNQELGVFGPTIGPLGEPDLLFAQGIAVRLGRALFVRRPEADDASDPNQGRAVGGGQEGLDSVGHGFAVVGVGHVQRGPAVALEAAIHVLAEGKVGVAFDGHGVVVVDPAQVGQLQVTSDGRRLAGNAFHHVAVAADGVDAIVEQAVAGPVESLGQPAFGDGHADTVPHPLAERTGGDLDPGGQPVFGVSRADAVQLPKGLDVVQADRRPPQGPALAVGRLHAGQMQQGVEHHRCVTRGQHEAVAVRPIRVLWVVAQESGPQGVGHRRQAHGRARVPRLRLLNRVDGQGADGVDRQLVDVVAGPCPGRLRLAQHVGCHGWRGGHGRFLPVLEPTPGRSPQALTPSFGGCLPRRMPNGRRAPRFPGGTVSR